MTKEQFSERLEGREYRHEFAEEDRELAEVHGLVAVYAYSDDTMVFDGAIRGCASCYDGGPVAVAPYGPFVSECECERCPYAEREAGKCKIIRAVWCGEGKPPWTYEMDIHHSKFNIYEDGEIWCIGIVFDLADLEEGNA